MPKCDASARKTQKKGGCPEGHPPLNTLETDYMVLPEAARCILISTFSVRLE